MEIKSETLSPNTLYYDSMCSFCSFFVKLLKKVYPITISSSWETPYTKNLMLTKHTWVYVDEVSKEWYKAAALLQILKKRRATTFLFTLCNNSRTINFLDNLYSVVAKKRICNQSPLKTKHRKLLKITLIGASVIFLLFTFYNRQIILYRVGNFFFEERSYNITLAKAFFIAADKSDDQKVTWLNYQLSRIYFIEGELNRAITYANKELRYHPDNCRTHYIRGLAFGYLDMLDAAIVDFEKFNSCFPTTWAGHNDLAWFYFRKGDMQKVIRTIEEVINLHPTNPWIYNTYGTALMNVGRKKEALAALKNAKRSAENMSKEDWGLAYPGNDPAIYSFGFAKMKETIDSNIKILEDTKK